MWKKFLWLGNLTDLWIIMMAKHEQKKEVHHLLFSPQIQAAAHKTSAQLPSSCEFARNVSSRNNLVINSTPQRLTPLTLATISTS
jgi:hypothetical protein